jgi:two-component sensor histidine kinase
LASDASVYLSDTLKVMFKPIIVVALIFFVLPIRAQDRRYLDSLHKALRTATADTSRLHTYTSLASYSLGFAYVNKNYVDSVDIFIREAQRVNTKCKLDDYKNYIDVFLSIVYCFRNRSTDASIVFAPCIAYARRAGYKQNELTALQNIFYFSAGNVKAYKGVINAYRSQLILEKQMGIKQDIGLVARNLASLPTRQGDADWAIKELLQIIEKNKSAPVKDLQICYDQLGFLYVRQGNMDKALYYALKTIKTMLFSGDSVKATLYYNRVAIIYADLGKLDLSLIWSYKALNHDILIKDLNHIFYMSHYIVRHLLTQGKTRKAFTFIEDKKAHFRPVNVDERRILARDMGNIYSALNKNDLAEKSFMEMLKLGNEEKGYIETVQIALDYQSVGDFYMHAKKYKLAKKYLLQSLNKFGGVGRADDFLSMHLHLFKIDSALGNYTSAIQHLQKSNQLKDSIFNVSKNRQVEELQIAYATDQKEKDFKLLQGKDKLQRTKLHSAEVMRNWIIAGASLLAIIAGLLYRQSQLKQKNNITIKQKNTLLQNLVTEKEWLLKEVHHRVKNNLHTVICLLESQAAYLENDALKAIENSQHRIYAMSLIHQKLYQSDDIKAIDMSVYIPELIQYLEDSFDVAGRVHFGLEIAPVCLNIAYAIPLGLIINEAVTNSIKYAFPEERKGEIRITLDNDNQRIKLELADNGVGIPKMIDQAEPGSLGLQLMKGLSQDIMADIYVENNQGTKITVLFHQHELNSESAWNEPAMEGAAR